MGHVFSKMRSDELKEKTKKNEKDFQRNRKIGFFPLVALILRMVRKSTQLELDEFREMFMPEEAAKTTYTKQSFSEARQKLLPDAFTLLNDELIQAYYEDGDFKTYQGFRLLAMDGSVIELPNTKETQENYGYTTTYKVGFRIARALSSHLYDVENKLVLSTCLSRYDDNERDLAKRNIEHMLRLESAPVRNLILFDRGYPSADFMLYLQEKGISYLMRAQGSFYKEIMNTTLPDEIVTIEITKARAKELTKQGKSIAAGTILQVRVIKVELSTGETETLLTNVGANELGYEACKPLYFKRWGIETRFDDLKHKFEIENFSGQKPQLIEQDFYATVLLSNMASIMEQEAKQTQMKENKRTEQLKYTEYRINKNILVGKLRNRFIEMVLEEDDARRDELHERFLVELQRNIVPVVTGRSFKRDKQTKANKFTKTKRRGL